MPQPNAPHVQQYFDELIQQLGAPPIACGFAGEHRGKAIFAERAIKAGELIYSERPFVAMQHEDNKDFADCCEHCFVPLINSKDAWERVEAANAEQNQNDVATFQDFEAAVQFLQKEGGKSDEESYFSVFRVAKNMVACDCGVLYCSEKCKQAAWQEQHAFMCPRADDNATPMGQFMNHTLATNEIFQLAGKVIAKILGRFVATHDLAYARQPVDIFCKLPWWEVVVNEEDIEAGETLDGQRQVFKALLQQTLDIFLAGLKDNLETMYKHDELNGLSADAVLGSCADVLNVEFFGSVVGMFEMNNMSMEIDHPFHTISEALLESVTEGKKEAPPVLVKVKDALEVYANKYQHAMCDHDHDHDHEDGHGHDHSHDHDHHHHHHAHDHSHDHDHDHGHAHGEDLDDCCEGEEEDFVGVEGTALFSTICTMNHDCDPNCTVIYMKDGTGHVYAVQDINKGDELRISYIDVDQSVEDRELSLREYQFKCMCARCEEERHA